MHVSGISFDLYWVLQLVFTTLIVALGFRHLVKNTASKYFAVDANFDGGRSQGAESSGPRISGDEMLALDCDGDACIVCGKSASKKCSRCKAFRYCSQICQAKHWNSGHKTKCKEFKLNGGENSVPSVTSNLLRGASCHGGKSSGGVSLVPGGRTHKILQQPKMVLFPYDEFVKLFNWDKPGFPPCGLINCGNSCFANVVLQCLSCTRPLVAYLLEKGHRRACRRNDWCFLCELQIHVERSSSQHPFSPISILSRLPHMGGNLGYGKQEDAHEFMRFAIDTMQSVCLDEFGGEKSLHPSSQETTLIQHIFGGYLRSQVICTKCNNVSNRYENMMDLAVEIQGDVASLEDCLHQFTDKEWLDGENMYKCDGCNDYVKAWKRLTIHQAPNILTIALKRFQSGRFGKLNKRVTFPETLGLRPYMSEEGDAADLYKLYAVVVHLDMLNASFFGHYICYTKDFSGNWYWIDDCKVVPVDLEEVLSQGAYMLLYRRNCARPAFRFLEPLAEEQKLVEGAQPCSQQPLESFNTSEPVNSVSIPGCLTSNICSHLKDSNSTGGSSLKFHSEAVRRDPLYFDFDVPESSSSDSRDPRGCSSENYHAAAEITSPNKSAHGRLSDLTSSELSIADAYSLENEFTSSNSDMEYGLENGNEERGNNVEIISSECKINGSSPHNRVQQISGTSLTVLGDDLFSASETIDETDPSRFENFQNTLLDHAGMIKSGIECPSLNAVEATVPKSRENSCSGAKLKPIFPPGFLGKRTRDTQTKRNGKPPLEPGEVCKVNGDCNGTAKPVFIDRSSGDVHDGEIPLDCDGTSIFRTSVGEQSENFIHMDEVDDIELGEVGNHKNCDCNGDDQFVNSQDGGAIVYERDAGHDASSRNCGDCSIKYNLPMVSYRFLDRPVGNPSGNEVGKAKSD